MTGTIASLYPAQRFGYVKTSEPITVGQRNIPAGSVIRFPARNLKNEYINNVWAGMEVTFTIARTKKSEREFEAEEVEVAW